MAEFARIMAPQRGTLGSRNLERHRLLNELRVVANRNPALSQALIDGLLADIVDSIDNDRWVAAICLLHVGVDALANLLPLKPPKNRSRYEGVLRSYVLTDMPEEDAAIFASELYFSRCGILHAMNVEGDATLATVGVDENPAHGVIE